MCVQQGLGDRKRKSEQREREREKRATFLVRKLAAALGCGRMDTGMEDEKERAAVRYPRRLRRAVTLCRWIFEGLALLALLSWSSDRLPTVLAVGATLLPRLAAVLFHPASAFVLGNIIVVTLFAKSGGAHAAEVPVSPLPPSPSTRGDALDHPCYHSYFSAAPLPRLYRVEGEEELDVVYEDKAVCVESTGTTTVAAAPTTDYTSLTVSPIKGRQKGFPLLRSRTSSDIPIAAVAKASPGEKLLRPPETYAGASLRVAERWQPEEEVGEAAEAEGGRRRLAAAADDNEEFRLRIESFISKQLRFIEREEESLLLAANGATSTGPGAVAIVVAAGGPEFHRC